MESGDVNLGFTGDFSVLNALGGTGIPADTYPAIYPTQQVAPVPGSSQTIKTPWGIVRGFAYGGFARGVSNDNSLARLGNLRRGKVGAASQGEGYPIPTIANPQDETVKDPPTGTLIRKSAVTGTQSQLPVLMLAVFGVVLWGIA